MSSPARCGVLALLGVAACSSSPAPAPFPSTGESTGDRGGAAAVQSGPSPTSSAAAPETDPGPPDPRVEAMLQRVAATRNLPIKRPVQSRSLGRDELLRRLKEKVAEEIPEGVIELQGETLAALGLVAAEYDFVDGVFALLQGSIAGYYEPEDGTMYLLDDLDDDLARETLAHELVHALQDQSFPLDPFIQYVPGDSDRIAAAHGVIEGDATSAMLEVSLGSAFMVSEAALRKMISLSMAMSPGSSSAPSVLTSSLSAPYIDGFAFVQARRKQGGWPAVDDAFRRMPETTEQLLHPEKYDRREPALPVAAPPVGALGAGFEPAYDDTLGEQGLRITLEEWVPHVTAVQAAAGWGGDRYVIAMKGKPGERREVAFAWHIKMDTPAERAELDAALGAGLGKRCRERPDLGPIAWVARGPDAVIVAGPYERAAGSARGARSTGTCALAERWASAILAAPGLAPPKGPKP